MPQQWECPNCNVTDVTEEVRPHSRFHICSGLRGLTAPMVPVGTDCTVRAVTRQDYVGREIVTYDGEGTPVSAIETIRGDGSTDTAVFAPCVNGKVGAE